MRLTRGGIAVAGVLVAAVAVAVLVTGGLTGVDQLWPVLLGAAIGFAPGQVAGRLGGFVVGVGAGWAGVVVRLVLLPDTAGGRATAGAVVLLALLAVSVASHERIPLWSMLVGAAGFLALAEGQLDPSAFAVDRLGAAGSLLLGGGVGAAAAVLARAGLAVSGLGVGPAEEPTAAHEPAAAEEPAAADVHAPEDDA